jgi:hypothetical protein
MFLYVYNLFLFFLDRPESSLTVASECSSTISSEEDEKAVITTEAEVILAASIEVDKPAEEDAEIEVPPQSPTTSSISGESGTGGDTWNTPTNQSTPVKTLPDNTEDQKKTTGGRLANLFNAMKIPKFKLKKPGSSSSEPSSLETTPSKITPQSEPKRPAFARSSSVSSDKGGLMGDGSGFVRNTGERHSYRVPSAPSRYMQAAEAHAAKNRASRTNSNQSNTAASAAGGGTWSGSKNTWSGGRSRSRAAVTTDTFRPPSRGYSSRPASRTTSASPGPWRRRHPSGGSSTGSPEDRSHNYAPPPSSTHSTPRRKPNLTTSKSEKAMMSTSVGAKSSRTLADMDMQEEDMILKRMEEILLTYKSRVEDHLAAEGRELPKEIFEDFTSQWVATSSSNNSRSMTSESGTSGSSTLPRSAATPRKAKVRDSSKTRIPMPTFYNSSPSPNETNI